MTIGVEWSGFVAMNSGRAELKAFVQEAWWSPLMLQLTDFSLRQLQITAILKPIILRRWGLDRRDEKTPNLTKGTPS